MASTTAEKSRFILATGLLVFAQAALATGGGLDSVVSGGMLGSGSGASLPGSGAGSALAMGQSIGRLAEALTVIFGIYYCFKAVLIYMRMASGRAQGQGESLGGMMAHFVAGVFAYYSREFFSVVHNTVPMIPDFGVMVYDAALWRSLMS